MTDLFYDDIIRTPQKRPLAQQASGMCKHCGVGIPRPPARYCPACIARAGRIYEAYREAGLGDCFHMGRLHAARYEWREWKEMVAV